MSEVTRYEYDGGHGGSQEMLPFSGGAWVRAADYDALKARAAELESALRLAKPCVERDLKAAVKENFGYVNNDPWACAAVDARNAIDAALAGHSVDGFAPAAAVMPERMTTIPEGKTISYAAGYEAALDAVANLNRNTVPLELLERIADMLANPTHYNPSACDASADELRAILAGDKS